MKTPETQPRPLGSAHIVPNHTLLLTPKRSQLIGIGKKTKKHENSEVQRCQGVGFLNSNMWLAAD